MKTDEEGRIPRIRLKLNTIKPILERKKKGFEHYSSLIHVLSNCWEWINSQRVKASPVKQNEMISIRV